MDQEVQQGFQFSFIAMTTVGELAAFIQDPVLL
jgi:hypothetical protein